MNKVVYVKAFFKPLGNYKTVEVPTGETKKGFFGGEKQVYKKEFKWVQTGWSDREIDGERLADDIASAVKELNNQGYEVVSINSVMSGNYYYKCEKEGMSTFGSTTSGGWGYGYGYGYSYTEGVIIIANTNITPDEISLEKGRKNCPSCAETIKLEAKKCPFCGHAFDPNEVNQQVANRRLKLEERRLEQEIEKQEREKFEREMEEAGIRQCPMCGKWEMRRGAVIEDGSIGDWCSNCNMSLQKMMGKI